MKPFLAKKKEYIRKLFVITKQFLSILFNTLTIPFGDSLIVIHQMGKVASTSVEASLKQFYSWSSIHRTHILTKETFKTWKDFCLDPTMPDEYTQSALAQIAYGRMLRSRMELAKRRKEKCKVITFAREPIAYAVSSFFQNIFVFFPGVESKYEYHPELLDETKNYFLQQVYFFLDGSKHNSTRSKMTQYSLNWPLVFFDQELKSVFEIDVFSSNFPIQKGYEIYKGIYADVLLIKYECIHESIAKALKEFLDIDSFAMSRRNMSKQKAYYRLYKDFVDSVNIPEEFIKQYYDSKYARHFYSEGELTTFAKKWGKSQQICLSCASNTGVI